MWLVIVKVAMGVSALAVAVTLALGLPLRKPPGETISPGVWQNLTAGGKINLVCAVATFVLVLMNELIGYYDSQTREIIAKAERDRLEENLRSTRERLLESRLALGRTIVEVETLSRKNDYVVMSLDKNIVRQAVARIHLKNASGVGTTLRTIDGQPIVTIRGDEVRWALVCQKPLPPIDGTKGECAEIGYGSLVSNSASVALRTTIGSQILFGLRSGRGELEYRSPSVDFACNRLTEQMTEAMCELQVSIWREGRWEFRDREKFPAAGTTKISSEDACRRYEAIFGESCEQALSRLK